MEVLRVFRVCIYCNCVFLNKRFCYLVFLSTMIRQQYVDSRYMKETTDHV